MDIPGLKIIKNVITNILLKPDTTPISYEDVETPIISLTYNAISVSGVYIDRTTGVVSTSSGYSASDNIAVVKGQKYTATWEDFGGVIAIIPYDSSYNHVTDYEGVGYAWITSGTEFTIYSSYDVSYIRLWLDTETAIPITLVASSSVGGWDTGNTEIIQSPVQASFNLVNFINGYKISPKEESASTDELNELIIDSGNNEYNITVIRAPLNNPKEATLCLMLDNDNITQFVDFSCMKYHDEEQGQVGIYCQGRGDTPLPYFLVAFSDGTRYNKFRIDPDSIPVWITSAGIRIRTDNVGTADWETWDNTNSFIIDFNNCANGTFTTNDGKTVTVNHGLITSIV